MRLPALALAAVFVAVSLAGCATDAATESAPGVDAQLAYLQAHWDDRNVDGYGSLDGTDCVNFTSQGLIARGWQMNDEWWHVSAAGLHKYSSPWVSSTAFMNYLTERPELATAVDASDAQRGDIVQFDYDNSGNRDHTATISRIDPDGTILVIQHSDDAEFRSVNEQLETHDDGQGTAYYWHLADIAG